MMPLPRRWLSSLLVRVGGDVILFDCGEGTQIAWRATGWSFRRLSAICISHTHSDHIAGLPGLLHTVARHPGQVLSREQLLELGWVYEDYGDLRMADAAIRRLRAKLRQAGAPDTVISTVRGIGYKLVIDR